LNNNQQKAPSCGIGGWTYTDRESNPDWGDNSISGYATLGLGYAAAPPPNGFDVEVPATTLTALDQFVGTGAVVPDAGVQRNGGPYDGGSGYMRLGCDPYPQYWINALKTGNLLYELGLLGEGEGDDRVDRALAFLVRYWDVLAGQFDGAGWLGDYQAMFAMMKGLEGLGIELLPDGGVGPEDDIDWYADVARYIVDQQNPDGSWTAGGLSPRGLEPINTTWALLTLERAVPSFEIEVAFDMKPRSCRNPLNVKKMGVSPAAVLGTEEFDVTQIDPASVLLEGEVSPLRWALEDVAAPFDGEIGDPPDPYACTTEGPDGFLDLTLMFDTQELVEALGDVEDGEVRILTLTGKLKDEFGGQPIVGEDVVVILGE
jgi:hypothetical protein